MTKFTPGPWHICCTKCGGLYDEAHALLAWINPEGESEYPAGDMHLIAAAPDMYKTLDALWHEFSAYHSAWLNGDQDEPCFIEWLDKIEAALAKAQGEADD